MLASIALLILLLIEGGTCTFDWYIRPRELDGTKSDFTYDKDRTDGNKVLKLSRVPFDDLRDIFRYPSGFQNDRRTDFVFPDVEPSRARLRSVPACEGSTFCEDIADYPTDIVENILRNDGSIKNYANTDAVDTISPRMDVPSTESLCISMERVVYPKSAKSTSDEWLFIVNHRNFTQGVRIEECLDEGKACQLIDGFAEGYSTSCKQKYIYRQLTAIAADGSTRREFFPFPASCCCDVRFIAPRFGFSKPRSLSKPSY